MQPKRFLFLTNTCLLISLAFVLTWCRKADDTTTDPASQKLANEFFDVSAQTDATMKIVAGRLSERNNRTAFINKLSQQAGMPKWNDALRITEGGSGIMGMEAKGTVKKKMYAVPFVKPGAKRVSALLMVKVKGADTAYKIVYRQHYPDYGFEETAGQWNARKLMLLFAMMEEQLFGYKNFVVNDGRIMGGKIGDRFRISFEAAQSSSDPNNQLSSLVTTCKPYKSCVYVGGSTTPGSCATRSICKTEFVNDNEPGDWQNFQPDEGGGGGEMTDGGIVDPDPCPVQQGTAQTTWQDASGTTYVLNPCDENAWEPENVINNVENSCLTGMVDAAISNNIRHELVAFINNTFSLNEDLDLMFEDGTLLDESDDATTSPEGTASGIVRYRIRLNSQKLPASSKEYIAATIFHEVMHAWISHNKGKVIPDNISHGIMADPTTLNRMTTAVLSMYPSLDPIVAQDLCWGGLEQTQQWGLLSTDVKNRIIFNNTQHLTGNAGTKCN